MVIDREDLVTIGHEETWKYFVSTYNSVEAMRAYRHIITECLTRKKDNFENIIRGNMSIPEQERKTFPPGDLVSINGINMSLHFLINQFTQSFFQAGRNSFDYMSHIISDIYCSDLALKNVDFGLINRKYAQISNSAVKHYVDEISSSDIYAYICDYNNTIKHNYDMGISISVNANGLDMIGSIPPFDKNNNQYNSEELIQQMKKTHQFVIDEFGNLLRLIWPERFRTNGNECEEM